VEMNKHFNIQIFGRVQGVGFRYHAKQIARMHNLKGYVKNVYDGSVYIEVEGELEKINDFIKLCQEGPGFSSVKNVEVEEGEIKKFKVFEVKF
jgi:acylphosphatase